MMVERKEAESGTGNVLKADALGPSPSLDGLTFTRPRLFDSFAFAFDSHGRFFFIQNTYPSN